MAKKKTGTWPRTISASAGDAAASGDSGAPVNKTAAARKYISENSMGAPYSEIIAGVKSQYGFDIKNGDVSNAKSFLKKGGSIKGLRKVRKSGKKRGALAAKRAAKLAAAKPVAASGDVVSATLDLVAAVGLEQARAIIAGLGK